MEIRQGERVFLQGRNGCGKSSIIKAILNQYRQQGRDKKGLFMQLRDLPYILGEKMELPNNMIISYCAQDTSMLKGTIQRFAVENEIDLTLFMVLLRKLDFSRMQIEELILKFNPTMIMVEHDKMFTEHTATRIIHL